jgi:hypothetical protein
VGHRVPRIAFTYDDKHSFLGFQKISVLKGVGHQDSRAGRPGPARGFTRGNRLSGSETWSGKPEPGINSKYSTRARGARRAMYMNHNIWPQANSLHTWLQAKNMKTGIWRAPHYQWEPHWHILFFVIFNTFHLTLLLKNAISIRILSALSVFSLPFDLCSSTKVSFQTKSPGENAE